MKKTSKKDKDKEANSPFKINGVDFQYSLEVEYDERNPCQEGIDCCSNDYCRCGVLENIRVVENPTWDTIHVNLKLKKYSTFQLYLIDRILRTNGFYDKDNWDAIAVGGYYGEELGPIYLNNSIAQQVDNNVNEVMSLNNTTAQLEYVLNLEYGFILPAIKDKEWKIVEVNKDAISFGNENYYYKLDKDLIALYKDYELPRGVCLNNGGKYRIIDGYHRILAAPQSFEIISNVEEK